MTTSEPVLDPNVPSTDPAQEAPPAAAADTAETPLEAPVEPLNPSSDTTEPTAISSNPAIESVVVSRAESNARRLKCDDFRTRMWLISDSSDRKASIVIELINNPTFIDYFNFQDFSRYYGELFSIKLSKVNGLEEINKLKKEFKLMLSEVGKLSKSTIIELCNKDKYIKLPLSISIPIDIDSVNNNNNISRITRSNSEPINLVNSPINIKNGIIRRTSSRAPKYSPGKYSVDSINSDSDEMSVDSSVESMEVLKDITEKQPAAVLQLPVPVQAVIQPIVIASQDWSTYEPADISTELITSLLKSLNFKLIDNIGGGECLFAAMSQAQYKNQNKCKEIRELVFQHIIGNMESYLDNEEFYSNFNKLSGNKDNRSAIIISALNYISDHLKPKMYADIFLARTLAILFKKKIELYKLRQISPLQKDISIEVSGIYLPSDNCTPQDLEEMETVRIFHKGLHYMLIIDINADEKDYNVDIAIDGMPSSSNSIATVAPDPNPPAANIDPAAVPMDTDINKSSPNLNISELQEENKKLKLQLIDIAKLVEKQRLDLSLLEKNFNEFKKEIYSQPKNSNKSQVPKNGNGGTNPIIVDTPSNSTSGQIHPQRTDQVPINRSRQPQSIANIPKPPSYATVVGNGTSTGGITSDSVPSTGAVDPKVNNPITASNSKSPSTSKQVVLVSKVPFPPTYDPTIKAKGLNSIRSILIDSTLIDRDIINQVNIIRRNEFITILQFPNEEIAKQVLNKRKLINDYTNFDYYIRQDLSYQQRKQIAETSTANSNRYPTIPNRFQSTQQQHEEFNRQNGFQQVQYNRRNPGTVGYAPRRCN